MSRIFAQRRRTWRAATATATATAAVVATGAMLLAGSTTASAHPGMPSAVFDQDSVGWASVRDRTSAQFAADFASWRDKGYLVVDIDIEVQGGQQRIGAVFQQNTDGRAWRSLRNLTDAQFKTEWQKAKGEGKRLVDQETYVLGGTRYYAGVWVQNVEHLGWASYRNLTSAQFSEKFRQQKADGRMPVDVDSYNTGAGMRYAAAWVDNPGSTTGRT